MSIAVVDYQADHAADIFCRSLKETGFAVLKQHPVDFDLIDRVREEWLAFFSTQAKYDYPYDQKKQDGFFSEAVSETAKGHTEKDIKEYFQIYTHGRYPNEVSDQARTLFFQLNALAETLLGWIEASLPEDITQKLSIPLSEMIQDSPNTMMRILHYPPLTGKEAEGSIRAAAHEDINLITVLPSANEPGLQVKLSSGEWMPVPCDEKTIVINISDMLQEATDGYYRATTHRVMNPSFDKEHPNVSRLSTPLFLHPRSDVVLSERHTQASYLNERLRELGVID